MDSLAQTFKKDTKLQAMISSPTLSVDDKQQIVNELQKSTGVQDKDNTLKNFFHTLAENNRLSVLDGVAEKFTQLISASRGEVEMTITSAQPLDNKIVKQLESAVSKSQYVGQGKKLKVVPKVCCAKRNMRCQANDACRSTQISREVSLSRSVTELSTSVLLERLHG